MTNKENIEAHYEEYHKKRLAFNNLKNEMSGLLNSLPTGEAEQLLMVADKEWQKEWSLLMMLMGNANHYDWWDDEIIQLNY